MCVLGRDPAFCRINPVALILLFFNYCFQGSVVNMNVMRPIYNMFSENFGVNHTSLGWTLFVGESCSAFFINQEEF